MRALLIAFAALAGLSNPVQSAANAGLQRALGQVIVTALVIYGVALCGLLALSPLLGLNLRAASARLSDMPWWAWTGGLCNLIFVLAGATAARRIGSGTFTVTALVCAVLFSILLDHFGLLGLDQRAATWPRLLGAMLAIAGVALVARF